MSIVAELEALPEGGLTVQLLQGLDTVVPGAWTNVRSFDVLAAEAAGSDAPGLVAAVRAKAAELEARDGARYAQAAQLYGLVDRVDQLAAGAAVASKVGSMFGSLGFLKQFTPKPDTTQAVDAGLKLVAEVLAFGRLHGVPTTGPDGLARFAGALGDYARYDLMRIAAWVVVEGLVPLGPDFLSRILDTVRSLAEEGLQSNAVFSQVSGALPGETVDDKRAFIVSAIDTSGAWIERFVTEKGLTQEGALAQLQGVMSVAGGGLDYVAAAIDASTSYFSHTGTQTVARALAGHAVDALRDEAWDRYVASLS